MEEEKYSILIVDDVPKNIQLLAQVLDDAGYAVKAAMNGKEALAAVEKAVPDLILLDVMMPEMDGYETCNRLKEEKGLIEVPIIFLTAKNETEDVVKGFDLGAVDYVTKPFNAAELLSRVKTHVELKKARATIDQISEERKELIHVLCHDMANPIGFVLSVIDMAKEDPSFYEDMKDNIEKSMTNSLEMIGLVRNLMAIEGGKHDLDISPFELDGLISESVDILNIKLKEKNISIEREIPKGLEVRVERTSFVNSVLNNIITNAVKFSENGAKLSISAAKEGDEVRLRVRDYGIGMPESILNNLFDIKKKTSRKGTAGETGTGFGMPLMKKFVHIYGGELNVMSAEKKDSDDHGTTVELLLKG